MCEGAVFVGAFSDENWAGELTSRKNTKGVCVKLNSLIVYVCWTSKLQASFALSTAEAEVNTVQELTLVCDMLSELGNVVSKDASVFVDNLSKLSIDHNKTKHFAIKPCFLQEKTEIREISLEFLPI